MTARGEYCRSDNDNLSNVTVTSGSIEDAADIAALYSAEEAGCEGQENKGICHENKLYPNQENLNLESLQTSEVEEML